MTGGDLNKFFKDDATSDWRESLNFKNTQELFKIIDNIPGIIKGGWHCQPIWVLTDIAGEKDIIINFRYRDILGVIRSLLGHTLFKPDLVYAPIQQFRDNSFDSPSCVYNELYTGEWWQEMQEKLPYGAIIILLVFFSDKTLLTQHYKDFKAWPVYLIIGNLLGHLRRSQLRPTSVLLGFILIIPYKKTAD